jgi:5-(carboxyamino)imidazole ribonucleotide synthase
VTFPLLPGVPDAHGRVPVLGVLGGGQLGRMFVHAAQQIGFETAVLDPDARSPAGRVAHHHLSAAYGDDRALAQLAHLAAAVSTEFENVPADALRTLGSRVPVAPSGDAVAVCQHRLQEKAFFQKAGVPCAPHAAIQTAADVAGVPDTLFPAILKTATLGYDGKGQQTVRGRADLPAAWAALGQTPCVLEQRLPLQVELSVIVARGRDGASVHLPVQQNLHRGGILAVTQVPAPDVPADAARQAVDAARCIAEALDYVGVLCVEFFLLADGRLVANEMAPRPHNSGHYSLDACDCSQFDLQVRTLAGLPLVAPRLHSPAVMLNLLGDLWFPGGADAPARTPDWAAVLALPGARLHLYGKAEARPGRKMGHLNLVGAEASSVRTVALQACQLLGLPTF